MSGSGLIRAAEARRMPWKNGRGETVELLTSPPGAGLDDFDWRISMASVAADGPFSLFPGIDRTLAILEGEGLELAIGAAAPVRLTRGSDPHGFAADLPCRCRLLSGPVTDLNVMTRRGRWSHAVARLRLAGRARIGAAGATIVLVCREGAIRVGGGATLGRHDALSVADGEATDVEPLGGAAEALIVTISH